MARIASMAFSSILAWGGWPAFFLVIASGRFSAGQPPHAKIDEKAMDAMRAMGKELASLKQFALEAEETVDEFHENGMKVQMSTLRKILVARPHSIQATALADG